MSVYSAEALAAGHIPQEGAHQRAALFMLDALYPPDSYNQDGTPESWDTVNPHGVELAMVYGSTATGQSTLRSDVDILFVYAVDRAHTALPAINQAIRGAEDEFFAPVQPQIITTEGLYNPLQHRMDFLFVKHLLEIEQEQPMWMRPPSKSVNSLSEFLPNEPAKPTLQALAVRYLSGKLRRFGDAIATGDGEPDLGVMDDALKLPSAMGRKFLPATQRPWDVVPHITEKHQMTLDTMHKLEFWTPSSSPTSTADKMRRLVAYDQAYDNLLQQAISGVVALPDYSTWQRQNYGEIVELAHDVSAEAIDLLVSETDQGQAGLGSISRRFEDLFDDLGESPSG